MNKNYQKSKSQNGFTVIEMAIVIIISGMMFAAFINIYSKQQSQRKYTQTIENLDIMQGVVNQYFGTFGRYPCPARLDVPPGHVEYGIENCRPNINISCAVAPPVPATGLDCENFGGRDVDGDGTNEEITIGAIPVITISQALPFSKFNELAAIDGYGAKFTYAVTEKMTNANLMLSQTNPANPQAGAITIVDENRRDVTVPPSSAHYVMFSHGETQEGAYSKQGALIDSCFVSLALVPPAAVPPQGSAALPGMRNDTENCDNNDAAFIKGLISLANNDNFYDDIFTYRANSNSPIWKRSPLAGTATWLYNVNLGNVGINTTNPVSPLDVNGNVVAENTAEAVEFCDPTSAIPAGRANCMDPDLIGGPGDTCSPGEIATGIQNNSIICEDIFNIPSPPIPLTINFDCGLDVGDIDGDTDITEPLFATGLRMNFNTNILSPINCLPL